VILDRDGTIIVDCHYPSRTEQVELLPGAAEGLRALRRMGLGLVMISNQSGIGRGLLTVEQAEAVNVRLFELLAAEGITLEGSYYCPHAPADGCDCRKPQPVLALRAAAELDFVPAQCFVIGDKAADVELARNLGAVGILVRTDCGREAELAGSCQPDYVVDDLREAARVIELRIKN